MNTSRFLMGAFLMCALPASAQPELKPANGLPYPLVTPEEAARLVEIKPIKLHVRDVTIQEALEEVERQTGVSIETNNFFPDAKKKLSLDIETNSFKEATDAIFDEAGVEASLQKFGRGGQWNINWGGGRAQKSDAPTSGTGPFQIRLQSLSSNVNKTVQLGKTPNHIQNTSLNASLSIDSDPQLPIVGTPRIVTTRVEDDQGHSLLVEDKNPFGFGFGGGLPDSANVRLLEPSKNAHSISHLEGKTVYVLAAKHEIWEVTDVLNAKSPAHDFKTGDSAVNVSIVKARKTDNGVELEVVAKSSSMPQVGMGLMTNPMLQFSQITSSIRLVDAEGKILIPGGMSGSGGGNQQTVQLRYSLPLILVAPPAQGQPAPPAAAPTLAEPLKFVMDAPTDFVQTEVPFSFSNLPLP